MQPLKLLNSLVVTVPLNSQELYEKKLKNLIEESLA